MKKNNFFKKTLALGVASVLGITSIFSLASCNGVPTEKVEAENLSLQTSSQALADTTSTWKSFSSISGGWENVKEEITIPAGTQLKLNGNYGCLIGENCDDMEWLWTWISEEYGHCFEDFKNDCTPGSGTYDFVYTYSIDKIKYKITFDASQSHQCGCSWFDDKNVMLKSINIYFDDVQVYVSDCQEVCLERGEDCREMSYAQGAVLDSDVTVTLENDLYINTDAYDIAVEYFIYHTMCDSFDYLVPAKVPANAEIKANGNCSILLGDLDEHIYVLAPALRAKFNNTIVDYIAASTLNTSNNTYEYTLSFANERIKYVFGMTDQEPACGDDSWFADGGYLKYIRVFLADTMVIDVDYAPACPEGCYPDLASVDDTKTIVLDEELVLQGSDALEKYVIDTISESFSYLIDLQAPSLEGSNTFTVNVDSLLSQDEILSHVVATDDTDSSPEIVVESSTYTQAKQIGTFYIYVHAVDDAGNVSPTYPLTINVVDSTNPTMSATTKTVGNNEVLSQAQLLALFTATDNYYSSSELTIEIITDSYTSKSKIPGTYEVIAKATDPSGNYSTKSTNVTVTDATAPTIIATNKTAGNNAKLSDAELKALFTYNDDVTGTSALKFEYTSDNYSANYNKLGTYQVTAKVTDEAGNYSTATSTITVIDKTAPTITATNKTAVYNTLLSEDELKALFTYSDDISTNDNITLTITANTYTENYNKLGTYQVTAKVVDENSNEASATSTITVVDNVKPVITGADINITNATILTEEQIRSYYKVNDAYDGELSFTLTWIKNYLDTPEKVGVYSFTISAKDSSNNSISQNFNLNVTDGINPELWLDNYFIVVDTNTEVTQELLISYAAASLCVAEADIVSVDGSFVNSEAGIYILSAKLSDGTETPIKLSIVEGAELPTDEAKYQFDIKDIFKGEFWSNYASGWTNNFAWPHWTTVIAGVLLLGSLIITIIRKRK